MSDSTDSIIVENVEENIKLNFDTLVLSGGSTKGIIILGALQYLADNFYLSEVKNFIGTSSGAII